MAETSDEMMDKYFSGESFTYAEMIQGLRQGVRELSLFPVLCGSAVNCMGSLMLLDDIVDLLPNPMEATITRPPARTARRSLCGLPRRRAYGLRVQDRL